MNVEFTGVGGRDLRPGHNSNCSGSNICMFSNENIHTDRQRTIVLAGGRVANLPKIFLSSDDECEKKMQMFSTSKFRVTIAQNVIM